MDNNDILRRLRYILDYNNAQIQDLFKGVGQTIERETVSRWLKREEDDDFLVCPNSYLLLFLDGLILKRRGPRDGPPPKPERLSNNLIFRKLKIALSLQSDDIIKLLNGVGFRLSKHELSAFFRKSSHKHYRDCQDQVLRNFLQALAESGIVKTNKKQD
jgi:uncharacterized protein YehS (DUF1456 family)